MRKMLNDKSFWIILIISFISLAGLTVGVIFLTRESSKEFYSAGYIINSTASKTDKYYFGDNTIYKENVFDEYVFKNTDNKEVKTGKENFIHYNDKSLSFMKNGVILDLDGFNKDMVPYYNITDKSVIKYSNGGYVIETNDKKLVFSNILGRITENKYIVIGNDVRIKLAGNDSTVSGDYFEIMFVENGIVKIENKESSYQTVCEDTIIYVGSNIKINLGDKKVLFDDEEKLSLSEMTIDGNENIDIKPEGKVKKDDSNSGSGEGSDSDNNTTGNNVDNNTGGNTAGGDDFGEVNSVIKKEVSIDLISARVDSNTLSADFQVIDTANAINDKLMFVLKNLKTGEIKTKELANLTDVQHINMDGLIPDCNYFMNVVDSIGAQYFQKTFKTDGLDLKLNRGLVTTDSISYSIDFGTNLDIKSVNLSLYDEENKQVGETYTIEEGDTSEKTFSSLEHNKTYRAVVDSIVLKNVDYASTYTIKTSDSTLKEKPKLGATSVEMSEDGESFSLLMDEPEDPDNAIVKYTYEVYDINDINLDGEMNKVTEIVDTKLKTQTLKVGSNNIVPGAEYSVKVIVEYYDNYKSNEMETIYSNFKVSGKPYIEFEEENNESNFNTVKGKIKLFDDGCNIPIAGRSCSKVDAIQNNKIAIRYYTDSSDLGKIIPDVSFDPNTLEYDLFLEGLKENTTYNFEVYSDYVNGEIINKARYIGGFVVTTSSIDALKVQNWKQNDYSFETPISVNAEITSTIQEHYYGDKISSVTFNLYSIDNEEKTLIGSYTDNQNIEAKYYNKKFTITSNMFGINSLDELREISGGSLKEEYLIEITDVKDFGTNTFEIIENKFVYKTPLMLLLEDKVVAPDIIVEEITNIQTKSGEYKTPYGIKYESDLGDDIVRGYKVTAPFNKKSVNNFDGLTAIDLNLYVYDHYGKLVASDTLNLEDNHYTKYFFLDYGTDYYVSDKSMRRGNAYTFAYDVGIDSDFDGESDSLFPSDKPTSEEMISLKENPKINMYIDNSNSNSITYKYTIKDVDNSLFKYNSDENYSLYYKIIGDDEIYSTNVEKTSDYKSFTLSNLSNSSIYTLGYYRADTKQSKQTYVDINTYFFDGQYNGNDYQLGYKLEYTDFDNELKIVIDDNEFLNRISTYLVTLSTKDDEYQKVVNELSKCDTNDETARCIKIDYKDIASFKGKDITVSLDAFYDTGNVGFGQQSKLGTYFKNMGLVQDTDMNKLGFVFQMNGSNSPAQYVYLKDSGSYATSTGPRGIMGFELLPSTKLGEGWKLNTSSIVSYNSDKFVSYGQINASTKDKDIKVYPFGIYLVNKSTYVNPKVLDVVNLQTNDNKFKFTSIIPKVRTTYERLINGAIMNVYLSIDPSTLESDFIKTDGKYKFYIEIYEKNTCPETDESCVEDYSLVKTVPTDYDSLDNVVIDKLNPDSKYYYKILADMNKDGKKVKTPLFNLDNPGYVEFFKNFSTLEKKDILDSKGNVNYRYDSYSDVKNKIYTKRNLVFLTNLLNNKNFDIKYELYDTHEEGSEILVFEGTVSNDEIVSTAKKVDNKTTSTASYTKDVTDLDLVYGENYYTLKVYAVTTDLGKKLELFNEKLRDNCGNGQCFRKLNEPRFVITQEATIDSGTDGNDYGIKYNVTVIDSDKVIKDGAYHVELQVPATNSEGFVNANVCGESKTDICKHTINLLSNSSSMSFKGLNSDTQYEIYVYADTYMNNVSYTDSEKNKLIEVRKTQYTKSDLGFSLGLVSVKKKDNDFLSVKFQGGANVSNSIVGIEYVIKGQGSSVITSGKLGKTSSADTDTIKFYQDGDTGYSIINIPIPSGKELNSSNVVQITYFYKDNNGDIVALKIGNNTVQLYGVDK